MPGGHKLGVVTTYSMTWYNLFSGPVFTNIPILVLVLTLGFLL